MCVRLTSITFPVIRSSVLISAIQEWRYCGLVYKFFLINNIELKCSFVRCRKYHKSWSNGAAELHISVDLLCGTTAAELHNSVDLLCDTTAAELHNSVNLLCELARQREAKRKQAPQSEKNVCRRRKCNLKKNSLINCTGHPIMHRTPKTN